MRSLALLCCLVYAAPGVELGAFSARAFSIGSEYQEGQSKVVESPDGKKKLVIHYLKREETRHLDDISLYVEKHEVYKDLGKRGLCDALWSPDSLALAMTCSDGGPVGTWDVTLYRFDKSQPRLVKLPATAAFRYTKWHPRCFEREPANVGVIAFRENWKRIVVAVQVPPHSNCDSLGTFRAYEMALPSGRIVRQWGQLEAKKIFAQDIGAELKAAEDGCVRDPRSCWIPALHHSK